MDNPIKRRKLDNAVSFKPWGNYLLDSSNGIQEIRTRGLGLFNTFPDALLSDFLYTYVINPTAANCSHPKQNAFLIGSLQVLGAISQCSKAFYAYTYTDSLWRDITLTILQGKWKGFRHSWRSTFRHALSPALIKEIPIHVANLYSDSLFASNYCATVDINTLCDVSLDENGEIDVSHDTIQRVSSISAEEFKERFMDTNTPCIITDIVEKWTASREWTMDNLTQRFGDVVFRAESVDLTLSEYSTYLKSECTEESPLYLFDKKFVENCKGLGEEFETPDYFSQDLFKVLDEKRPDYRWIIIGPERSGSTFHIDPNSSKLSLTQTYRIASAWNAVITGAKKWILFPPSCTPPGIFVSGDQSEVTSPETLAEWYMHYYQEVKKLSQQTNSNKPIIGVCRAGEVVYVPNGWWHCVMNLSESIAITQNFVDECNLSNVFRFLRDKPDQVSGYKHGSLLDDFKKELNEKCPLALKNMIENEEKLDGTWSWDKPVQKQSLWSELGSSNHGSTFSFGFK